MSKREKLHVVIVVWFFAMSLIVNKRFFLHKLVVWWQHCTAFFAFSCWEGGRKQFYCTVQYTVDLLQLHIIENKHSGGHLYVLAQFWWIMSLQNGIKKQSWARTTWQCFSATKLLVFIFFVFILVHCLVATNY